MTRLKQAEEKSGGEVKQGGGSVVVGEATMFCAKSGQYRMPRFPGPVLNHVPTLVRIRVRARVRFSFCSFGFNFTEYIHAASYSMW